MPGRHSSSGFRLITVSTISVGAGSVAVAARPALPHTDATSGNDLMILSWVCKQLGGLGDRDARQRDGHIEQRALIQVGMNSLPSFDAGQRLTPSTASAIRMVSRLELEARARITGR